METKNPHRDLTEEQLKNWELLAKSLTDPLKTKEQIEQDSKEFQRRFKEMYG